MRRRSIAVLILLVLTVFSVSAKPEIWIGIDFESDTYTMAENMRDHYKGNGIYGGNPANLKDIRSIGPSFDVIFFPSDKVRIGLITSTSTLFAIGYKTESGISGYKSYNFDYRQDFSIGIAYNQMFSEMLGMYMNVKVGTELNQVATTNRKNSREEVEFNRVADFIYGMDLGLLTKNDNTFFKVGASLLHSFNTPILEGYSIQLSVGGGFVF